MLVWVYFLYARSIFTYFTFIWNINIDWNVFVLMIYLKIFKFAFIFLSILKRLANDSDTVESWTLNCSSKCWLLWQATFNWHWVHGTKGHHLEQAQYVFSLCCFIYVLYKLAIEFFFTYFISLGNSEIYFSECGRTSCVVSSERRQKPQMINF